LYIVLEQETVVFSRATGTSRYLGGTCLCRCCWIYSCYIIVTIDSFAAETRFVDEKKSRYGPRGGGMKSGVGRAVAAQSAPAVGRLAEQSAQLFAGFLSPRGMETPGARIERIFKGGSRATILFDDREGREESFPTVEKACRNWCAGGPTAALCFVAVVGGVVGDVAGFRCGKLCLVESGWCTSRSTLVAQVDSAVGAKRGVNLPEGKPCRCVLILRNW